MGIVAGQLIIGIVIGMGAIIAAIVHGDELEKVNGWILPVMLKKMSDKIREPKHLSCLGMGKQVYNDQTYS